MEMEMDIEVVPCYEIDSIIQINRYIIIHYHPSSSIVIQYRDPVAQSQNTPFIFLTKTILLDIQQSFHEKG